MRHAEPNLNLPLSGTDYFLLALEKDHRTKASQGYISRLSLTLQGRLKRADLEAALRSSKLARLIANTRFKRQFWIGKPVWRRSYDGRIPITEHMQPMGGVPPESRLSVEDLPIAFDLYPEGQGTTLVFSWHHAFMDAHGAEYFLKSLSSKDMGQTLNGALPKPTQHGSLKHQLLESKKAKQFMMTSAEGELATLTKGGDLSSYKTKYTTVLFNEEESKQVEQVCHSVGARFRRSAFYLSSSAYAINKILKDRGEAANDFLVPVPQDQRKRGACGPVLSNQVSFMFYRLPKDSFQDVKTLTQETTEQMMQHLRHGTTKSYATMMHLFRYVPLPVYANLIKGPTKGNMASFYFSDTGTSLDSLTSFLGQTVKGALHYPPNTYPPGFTVVTSQFKGRLSFTIAYLEEVLSISELSTFKTTLREALLGVTP